MIAYIIHICRSNLHILLLLYNPWPLTYSKHNLFLVTFGSVGSQFVTELAKLYDGYGSASALESIALKASMVLPPLLLQKPHRQSRSREHIKCLER